MTFNYNAYFRAWNKSSNGYYYFNMFDLKKYSLDDYEESDIENPIGIKDKNGNLVYTGDFVKYDDDNRIFEISYNKNIFAYSGRFLEDNHTFALAFLGLKENNIEVVGNKHQGVIK